MTVKDLIRELEKFSLGTVVVFEAQFSYQTGQNSDFSIVDQEFTDVDFEVEDYAVIAKLS